MLKSKNKRFHFNMVEIVLAIAILAFGFASVLGLFPVAIKAVRNSQAEGLANDAANNVYAYYKSYGNAINSTTGKYFHEELFVGTGIIDWTEFTASSLRTEVKKSDSMLYGNKFLNDLQSSADPTTDSNLGFQAGMNLFQPIVKKPCFFLVLGSADFKKTEFTAQIIVWKKQVSQLATPVSPNPGKFTYEQAVELNMEVSWPINIPYDDREKRYYQFVITNPTP